MGLVVFTPVVVFLLALLFIFGVRVEEGDGGELSSLGSVCRAMLNGGVTVANVTEVVDIAGAEESTSGERVDGCITPL